MVQANIYDIIAPMKFPSVEKKSSQLGMSLGTACHRLRKSIMFLLAQQAGRDICVRCGKKIETVDDLTIEHIKPWLDVDASLFWDLNNVGFSHSRCNVSDRKHGPPSFVGPPETSWCWGHQDFIPRENFTPSKRSHNGLQQECRECRSKRQKEHPWRKVKKMKEDGGL